MNLFPFFPTVHWAASYVAVVRPYLPHKTVNMQLLFRLSKNFFKDNPSRKSHTRDDSAVQDAGQSLWSVSAELRSVCFVPVLC